MTNSDYTHLGLVIDRSGSMGPISHDMEGGLRTFLEEQAELPGKLLVDVITFDDRIEHLYKGEEPSAIVGSLIKPRGMTSLYDGVGFSISTLGERFAALPEDDRPGKVLIVVITDGHENSSRDWRKETVLKAVKEQEDKYGWDFVFLGANLDSADAGGGIGFARDNTMDWQASSAGVAVATASLGNYTEGYRMTKGGAKSRSIRDISEDTTNA